MGERGGGDDGDVRQIVIVRHAKSDWNDGSLADHDRPLAPRGIKALGRMREHLAGSATPELVLCSTSRRTRETLGGIREVLPQDLEVRFDGELYGADTTSLLGCLRRVGDDVTSVMLVGHNPGLHDLAVELVGDGAPEAPASWERLAVEFPTGAIATLSTTVAWAHLDRGCADLDDFFTPRKPRRSR